MNDLQERLQGVLGDAYRIESELSGGGMSRLFVATEASLNRRVVVKVLPPESASEVSASRFKQEVEVAARLQHPHILPVLSAGARDGLLYYVMPFVEGESLRHLMLREQRLPVADALRILFEVADALTVAHRAGIIHRDIKPENILLEGRHAVLADFGIARALEQSRTGSHITSTGTSLGTPGYMSPEQLAGAAVDGSADVYALAVVGYEMLAGRAPFAGGSAQALMAAHLTATPTPLHELRPEVPRSVSAALARALAKDPAARFATAAEFAEAVDPALVAGRRDHGDDRTKRRLSVLGAIAATSLLIALVTSLVGRGRLTQAKFEHITAMAAVGDLDSIASLLHGVTRGLDRLDPLALTVLGVATIRTEPGQRHGILVRATPFSGFATRDAAWTGVLDGRPARLVAGEYLLRIPLREGDTLVRPLRIPSGDSLRMTIALAPEDSTSTGMRFVPGGRSPTGADVDAFLIDRFEVSNAEYGGFIAAGGYRDESLWPDSMLLDGRWLSRAQALSRFVDRSGLPGPRHWNSGHPPEGQADHPVVGVTWYEANAYARWSGKSLPTSAQWWRAALEQGGEVYPWGGDGASVGVRANLEGRGTVRRGSLPLGASPFGVEDLAGNAREWLADSTAAGGRRIVVGGSWQDPTYMFERSHAEAFHPGFANDAIGFRLVRPARPAGDRSTR